MIEENVTARLDNVCPREVQKSLEFSVKKPRIEDREYERGRANFEVQDKRIPTRRGGAIIRGVAESHCGLDQVARVGLIAHGSRRRKASVTAA